MKGDLIALYKLLCQNYAEQLTAGVEDPRTLKEIREFLRDNDINVNTLLTEHGAKNVVELPDDYLDGVANG